MENNFDKTCAIAKTDSAKQIVYGVVLEPDTCDLQGDVISADTIEKAAHDYLIASRVVGDSHMTQAPADVVESYIAPSDMVLGETKVTKGSWVMGVHIVDTVLWEAVQKGDYTGFSIGGYGTRSDIQKSGIPVDPEDIAEGETSESEDNGKCPTCGQDMPMNEAD